LSPEFVAAFGVKVFLENCALFGEKLEISCPRCGAYVEVEKVFCVRCGYRVIPLTPYDLSVNDFIYPPDRDGLESLKQFKFLLPIVNALVVKRYVNDMGRWLSRNAVKIDLSSELGSMIRECGVMLGLKALPEAYMLRSDKANAFTFGSGEKQYLVLTSSLVEILSKDELRATIAHELGHVKCEHVTYHTLAELLTSGLEFSSNIFGVGLEAISPMFKLILLSWHRESEVSADRASLLVVGDLEIIRSTLAKLSLNTSKDSKNAGGESIADSLLEIFSTHPTYPNRIKLLAEYYESREYAMAREKVKRRIKLAKALAPRCRYCGAAKKITDLFCPICKRSQI